ncbi:hypothetical protein F5Y05DRAFT_80299 [Hypoxylon sp. FL0543]|nr:hypothetical protein F5Y05DRAFT_80299 [Hypoxylon sp. FL0543]
MSPKSYIPKYVKRGGVQEINELLQVIHGRPPYQDLNDVRTVEVPRTVDPYHGRFGDNGESIEDSEIPPGVDPDQWKTEACHIIDALNLHYRKEWLYSDTIQVVWNVTISDIIQGKVMTEMVFPWVITHTAKNGFNQGTAKEIARTKPETLLLLGHTDLGDPDRKLTDPSKYKAPHYFTVVFVPDQKRVYYFDTLPNSPGRNLPACARHVFQQIRSAWTDDLRKSTETGVPKEIFYFDQIDQDDGWSCGYWSLVIPYLIYRRPSIMVQLISQEENDLAKVMANYMRSLSLYVGIKIGPTGKARTPLPSFKPINKVTKWVESNQPDASEPMDLESDSDQDEFYSDDQEESHPDDQEEEETVGVEQQVDLPENSPGSDHQSPGDNEKSVDSKSDQPENKEDSLIPNPTESPKMSTVDKGETAKASKKRKPAKPRITKVEIPSRPKYDDLLPLDPPPEIGPERVAFYRAGNLPPFRWVGDTYETLGNRPQPCAPAAWQGWDHYLSLISERERQFEVSKPGPREVREANIAKRAAAKGEPVTELMELSGLRKARPVKRVKIDSDQDEEAPSTH